MAFSSRQFRDVLGRFATGVCVVTCRRGSPDGEPVGLTVNSFTSVSLDPPLILWCLDKGSDRFTVFSQAPAFAVNILSREQEALSAGFAMSGTEGFAAYGWAPGEYGVPVLEGAHGVLQCAAHTVHEAGDHVIVVGRVLSLAAGPGGPLLYYQGAYGLG